MESDLQFIEIAEEDDSLLQQQKLPDPNEESSKSVDYFTCSPLQLRPPFSEGLKDSMDIEKPSYSYSKSSSNKENINMDNLEEPKLGVEPMQMKRRKKGGGYNLRKSLAWDRAFFTDEGILDPLEFSLITGINGNSCREQLETLSEGGKNSFSADTKFKNDSESFRETLCKGLSDKRCTSKAVREKAGWSEQNHNSLSHDKVACRVPAVAGVNGTGSSSCPRPLASSLKRAANASTAKTGRQGSKLPKLPAPKPGPFSSTARKGSVTAKELRHNPNPIPAIDNQKNSGLKSSLKNVKISQTKARTSSGSLPSPAKVPVQTTLRQQASSSSKVASSTESRLSQVGKANGGSEVIPDRLQLSEIKEGSVPLATKVLAQHAARKMTNLLPEADRSANSSHSGKASSDLRISDRLHSCEGQEISAALAVSCVSNLCTNYSEPSKNELAKRSGLRLPSPSLGFFDQRRALESNSLLQKQTQAFNTNLDSSSTIIRKNCELRPPTVPAKASIKSKDNADGRCSRISTSSKQCSSPSSLSSHSCRSQLNPSRSFMGSISSGVSDSNMKPNFERRIAQEVDISVHYACRSSEHKTHEEAKHIALGHVERSEMEWIERKDDWEVNISNKHVLLERDFPEPLEEGNGASIISSGEAGCNEVGAGTPQPMCQDIDESVAIVPGTEGKLVHPDKEDKLQNSSAISESTSGQYIWHQEQSSPLVFDSSTKNLGRPSRDQADRDREKSNFPKVDPEFHVDGSCQEAIDSVSKVFGEARKDEIGKRRDDVKAPEGDGTQLENHDLAVQTEKTVQGKDVGIHVKDDTGCHLDSPCCETRVSVTFGESQKVEAGKGGKADARDSTCAGVILDTFCTSLENQYTEQGNNRADHIVFSIRSPVRDAGALALCENLSAIDFNINPSTSMNSKAQSEDSCRNDVSAKCIEATTLCLSTVPKSQSYCQGLSLDYIVPAGSSSLDRHPCDHTVEGIRCSVQGRSRWGRDSSSTLEVPGQTQNVDVDLMPDQSPTEEHMGFDEVSLLVDDCSHPNTPNLQPGVGLISEAASVGADEALNTVSVLQVSQGAETYLQSLKVERLDRAVVTSEAEGKLHEDSSYHESRAVEIGFRSLSRKSVAAEESQHSHGSNIFDASHTVQGCIDGLEISCRQFLSDQTLKEAGAVGNFTKSHIEVAPVQLLDHDISCSWHSSVVQGQSLQIVDCGGVLEKQLSNAMVEVEQFSKSNQLLTNSKENQQEIVSESVRNDVKQNDVHEYNPDISNVIVDAPPVVQEGGFDRDVCDHLCFDYETLDLSTVNSADEHNKNATDGKLALNADCFELALISELDSGGKDQMVDVRATLNYSCPLPPKEVAGSFEVLQQKPVVPGSCIQIEQDVADNHMDDSLSPIKIPSLKQPQHGNVLGSVMGVQDQSINNGCDLECSNASAQILHRVSDNFCELDGDVQQYIDTAPQGLVGKLPSVESLEYLISGDGLESSGQEPSSFTMDSTISQHPSIGVRTTSSKFYSITNVSCSVLGEDESLSTSTESVGADEPTEHLEEETLIENFEDSNGPTVGEFHHELDSVGRINNIEGASVSICKRSNNVGRQDNPMVICPPNAIPFSDEWLAAFEAAGEEILTIKCGAVQHSPPDKAHPEPGPWSPVKKKANQIGPYDCTKYTNMPSNSP